jgi:hypothetical protein
MPVVLARPTRQRRNGMNFSGFSPAAFLPAAIL